MMKTREQVTLNLLEDNPWQPRQDMDQESLQQLADDIHLLGLLQVPLARPSPTHVGRYQLAFGHRRVAALRLLREQVKWPDHIELDVEGLSDEKMAVIALSENVQRRQLTSIEVVRAHKRAIDETTLSIQALAEQIGVDRSTLSNNLRVLSLPGFVLEHVESGALSLSVAREFLVLQHGDHAHENDMEAVVRVIRGTYGRRGAPDWSRRHVREQIYLRVAYNEKDWRPLGPSRNTLSARPTRRPPSTLRRSPRNSRTGSTPYPPSPKWSRSIGRGGSFATCPGRGPARSRNGVAGSPRPPAS